MFGPTLKVPHPTRSAYHPYLTASHYPPTISHTRFCLPAGNFAETRTVFDPLLAVPPPRVFRTTFNSNLAFGPSPQEKPSIVVTASWKHLQVGHPPRQRILTHLGTPYLVI